MRPVGSLLIAIALSFLTVYPLMLGIFYIMSPVLVDSTTNFAPSGININQYNEGVFATASNGGAQLAVSTGGEGVVKCIYFSSSSGCIGKAIADMATGGIGVFAPGGSDFDLERPTDAIAFAAYAFIAAVFFPTAALLATIASVSYTARLMGEEVDLSRLTQLV